MRNLIQQGRMTPKRVFILSYDVILMSMFRLTDGVSKWNAFVLFYPRLLLVGKQFSHGFPQCFAKQTQWGNNVPGPTKQFVKTVRHDSLKECCCCLEQKKISTKTAAALKYSDLVLKGQVDYSTWQARLSCTAWLNIFVLVTYKSSYITSKSAYMTNIKSMVYSTTPQK